MFCLIPIATQTWESLLGMSNPLVYAGHEDGDPVMTYMQKCRKEESSVYEILASYGLEEALDRIDPGAPGLSNTTRAKRHQKLIHLINKQHHCFRPDQMECFQDDVAYLDAPEVERRSALLTSIPETRLSADAEQELIREYIGFYRQCAVQKKGLLLWNLSKFDFLPD